MTNTKNMLSELPKLALINIFIFIFIFATLEVTTRVVMWLARGETAYLKYWVKYPKVNFSHVSPLYYHDMGEYLAFRHMTHPKVSWADGPVYINQYGFRTKDFTIEKPVSVYRILTMGESSTFAFHVSDNKAWPYLLNEKFKDSNLGNKKVEVINLGLPWYSSQDNINLLDFALTLNPDLVIYYGAANDIVDLSLPKLLQKSNPAFLRYLLQAEEYSLFLNKARIFFQTNIVKPMSSLPNGLRNPDAQVYLQRADIQGSVDKLFIEPFEANIISLRDKVQKHNAKFVLIKQIRAPLGREWLELQKKEGKYNDDLQTFERLLKEKNFYSYYDYLSGKLSLEQHLNLIDTVQYMHTRLATHLDVFAKENNIPLVDFIKYVDGDFKLLKTDLHLSEQGNDALASTIFHYLTN